jgi:hypothetical protein
MRLNSTHYLIRSTGRGLGSCAGNYRHTSLRKPLPGVLVVCAFASFVWYYCLHSWDGGVPTRTELTSAGFFSALKISSVLGLSAGFRGPKTGLRGNAGVGTDFCDVSQGSLFLWWFVSFVRGFGTVGSFLGQLSHATSLHSGPRRLLKFLSIGATRV